jgi:hypothetical protein
VTSLSFSAPTNCGERNWGMIGFFLYSLQRLGSDFINHCRPCLGVIPIDITTTNFIKITLNGSKIVFVKTHMLTTVNDYLTIRRGANY